MIPSVVVGSFTGDGTAKNILIGFQPDYVMIADATNGNLVDIWFRGMAAGTSISVGTPATRATNGITAYPLAATANPQGEGFTAGTALSVNAAVMRYIACRSGPGAS